MYTAVNPGKEVKTKPRNASSQQWRQTEELAEHTAAVTQLKVRQHRKSECQRLREAISPRLGRNTRPPYTGTPIQLDSANLKMKTQHSWPTSTEDSAGRCNRGLTLSWLHHP